MTTDPQNWLARCTCTWVEYQKTNVDPMCPLHADELLRDYCVYCKCYIGDRIEHYRIAHS